MVTHSTRCGAMGARTVLLLALTLGLAWSVSHFLPSAADENAGSGLSSISAVEGGGESQVDQRGPRADNSQGHFTRESAIGAQPRDSAAAHGETPLSLHGQVLSPTGQPVAGALVFVNSKKLPGEFETTCDEQGHFQLDGAEPGTWRIGAWSEGFAPVRKSIELPASEEVVLTLGPVGRLVGRVLDPEHGTYTITLKLLGEWEREWDETFDLSDFEITALPPGEYELWFHPHGVPKRSLPTIQIVAGETVDLGTLAVGIGAEIWGLIARAGTGEPLRATCTLYRNDPGGAIYKWPEVEEVKSGFDGSFRFRGLTEGLYRVNISAHGSGSIRLDELALASGMALDLGLLELVRAGEVVVQLVASDSSMLGGRNVSVSDRWTFRGGTGTDRQGRCRFESVTPGPISARIPLSDKMMGGAFVKISGELAEGATLELVADLDALDLRSWSARLLDRGQPAPGFTLQLTAEDWAWRSSSAHSAEDGRFELECVGGGKATLSVTGPEQYTVRATMLLEPNSAGHFPTVIELPPVDE